MKIKLLFLLLMLNQFGFAQTENLFDEKNTIKFAKYLHNTGNYKFAAEEFERLYFLSPQQNYAHQMVKNYRMANEFNHATNRFAQFPDSLKNDKEILKEFYRVQILNKQYDFVYKDITTRKAFSETENTNWALAMLMLEKKYTDAAYLIKNDSCLAKYDYLLVSYEQLHLKNAYLAATLSAIIPGSGKLYAGRWKDAVFSFVLVGSTAFQAYRGFSKNGVNSLYGWIFSGLSVSFYAGNIFGAYDATNLYNKNVYEKYHQKVSTAFYPLIWNE